jgi:molybdopterin-containing oxidoreductase family iron-sulfur binding subunit
MNEPVNPKHTKSAEEKQYFRSLDQLADTPEFRDFLHREFPANASEWLDGQEGMDRRKFLTLMSASLALAGLAAGCRRPVEKILPATKVSELTLAGDAQFYATIMNLGGAALGLLVRSNDGRPTKIEGNPAHPESLGATNAYAQASVLSLYDPERSQFVRRDGKRLEDSNSRDIGWDEFSKFAAAHFADLKAKQGTGLRILAESVSSPALREAKDAFLKVFPQAKWHTWDAISKDNALAGAQLATGQLVQAHYDFDKADVVLSADADFLATEQGSVASTKKFSRKRRVMANADEMNRLYVAETNFTVTGAMADHRLRLQSRQVGAFLAAVAKELGVAGIDGIAGKYSSDKKFVSAVAKDLAAHKGKSVVVVGSRQPAAVHALGHLINSVLSNTGATVRYTRAFNDTFERSVDSLKSLVNDINGGQVNTLVILGINPVFTSPADVNFGEAVKKVSTKIHLGLENDETAAACNWHLNEAHFLETWGDGRASDGTASIQQPLIDPLFGGKSAMELLAMLSGAEQQKGYDIVRSTWQKQIATGFDKAWERALSEGLIAGTAFPAITPSINAGSITAELDKMANASGGALVAPKGDIEINFVQDASVYDGRFANNAWLQETPDPMTKLTWDNAALMSITTAKRLGVEKEDVIKLVYRGRELEMPALPLPGHADDSITVSLGYGRLQVGKIGRGENYTYQDKVGELLTSFLGSTPINSGGGFNANKLRMSDALDGGAGVTVTKVGRKYPLACTQDHWSMEGRNIVLEGSIEEFKKEPNYFKDKLEEVKASDLYEPGYKFESGNQWGMAIDLNACTGCNACVVACQSENNIPVVGKEQVRRGREMNWIRMDRYFVGSGYPDTKLAPGGEVKPESQPEFNEDHIQAVYQPVACQQCENAPCENVCPVAATVHSDEGLNAMAYNRCIGTRYCSNNCPYKVRRFNFANWHEDLKKPENAVQKMVYNPEVTVRVRGVMEKCTYCVQRIMNTRIRVKAQARRAGEEWKLPDGAIVPACAQTCPADAIVFGDIRDVSSRVAQWKKNPRNYDLLAEINVKPRTSYLAKLRNPNAELEPSTGHSKKESHG